MTRSERAGIVRDFYLEQLHDDEKKFVQFILNTYEQSGEKELSMDNLRRLVELQYHTMSEAVQKLGTAEEIVEDYLKLQEELYEAVSA